MEGMLKNEQTPMFYKTEYTHEQNGQTYPMYLMNRGKQCAVVPP